MSNPDFEERPWGRYDVLSKISVPDSVGELSDVVIKKIVINPGARVSYQSHKNRAEHWYVVSGIGAVTIEGKESQISVGESVDVKKGEKHRMANTGNLPLVFIEVATGAVDEEDIIRYEDDFGRTS